MTLCTSHGEACEAVNKTVVSKPTSPLTSSPMVRAPNILWIVTTQWRGQALGYCGDVNVRTPFLDRWAGKSTNYSQAVTPHPFGPFARAAMLTGMHSPENGISN